MPVSPTLTTTAAPASPATEYRPAIDGLRAVAVIAVFLFHLNRRWLPGGFFGVDIFFVISGYLITSVILRDCENHRFRFGRFYQRRIARLLPAFFAVAIATLTGAFLIYSPQDLASTAATLSAAAASVANLKFMLQGNYFRLSPDAQPFLHCWSLSVEEQFYLLFPAALVVLYRTGWRHRMIHVLAGAFAASLLSYLVLTYTRPEWAFYLLPARAWELLAGSILAIAPLPIRWGGSTGPLPAPRPAGSAKDRDKGGLPNQLPGMFLTYVGLILIAISFSDGQYAILPVAGAVCLLLPGNGRILSSKALVAVGRMSYSLYLWHWPVFSLVDYKFYWRPMLVRLVLKISVSIVAAAGSYWFIEQPGRIFLNRPDRRRLAFAALAASLAILIPLGIIVRNANYVNADAREIRNGGLHFNPKGKNGSMVLMGDSNGSMYGKMLTEIARARDLRLDVISVEAGDPLPRPVGQSSPLWRESLAVVKKDRPNFLVFVCKWEKLREDRNRLTIALRELTPYARWIFLITQPPVLPEAASREGIRNGNRPPFRENAAERASRIELNEFVKSCAGENVKVVDIEALFSRRAGEIRFVDDHKTQLYQDRDHLSAAGANLVKPALIEAITGVNR